MHEPRDSARRRPRREWTKLVAAWQRSGLTAKAFAASRGVSPRTLAWWKWHLAQAPSVRSRPGPEALRLVRVEPEAATPSPAAPAWELSLASGAVLRVHTDIPSAALRVLLERLGTVR